MENLKIWKNKNLEQISLLKKGQGASHPIAGLALAKRKPVIRYDVNPFYDKMDIPIKDKSVRISRLGNSEEVVIDNTKHRVHGTHVASYRKVDNEMFVKLFTQNIVQTFHLNSPGIKALSVLIFAVQHYAMCKDLVPLDVFTLEKFIKVYAVKLSVPTLNRGIKELVDTKIIARTKRQGDFFLNPNFVFNGNRITFSTTIERDDLPPSGDS